jgi:hypothetical protein
MPEAGSRFSVSCAGEEIEMLRHKQATEATLQRIGKQIPFADVRFILSSWISVP